MQIIHPLSTFFMRWNIVILFVILYNALLIPFQLAFDDSFGNIVHYLNYSLDILLVIDLYLQFHKAYYHQGLLVKDKKKVVGNYLKGWFAIDFMATLPFDLLALLIGIHYFGGMEYLPLLRLPRLLRISRVLFYFSEWEKDVHVNPAILRIAKLALTVSLMAHMIACGWFHIGIFEAEAGGVSWVVEENLVDAPTSHQYLRSLYWSLTTMTTVGYGDITPITPNETFFALIGMVVGVSIYAYIVGNMASLVANLDAAAQEFRKKMDSLNDYMRFREIPRDLQNRIRNYFDYIWALNKGLDEEVLLNELPSALRTEVALYLHRDVLSKVPLFLGAEQGFLNSLVMLLDHVVYSPGDYIIRADEVGKEMFFISKGSVEVISPDGKTIFATLSGGSFFGEIALLFSERRTASIRATTFCDLFRLTKDDLEKVLVDYPEFKKDMLVIAEERYNK